MAEYRKSLKSLGRETIQKRAAAMGKSPHSGGLLFISKMAASLLPASAARIRIGFICNPPNEIF